jgi:NAD(P)-dependent dehydrogenase (short-subunit alcohol dehydrogenase family)
MTDSRKTAIVTGASQGIGAAAPRDTRAQGTPNAAGSAHDRDLHSLGFEAPSIGATKNEILVPSHHIHSLFKGG